VEAVATGTLVVVGGQIGATLMSYGTNQIGAYIGISNTFLLATFIYAAAPASGGHMNPMITFSTMLTGLCPVPRGWRCTSAAGSMHLGFADIRT